jgi:hypothetical protein
VASRGGAGYSERKPRRPCEPSVPRGPRVDAPGMVHHVWTRAVDGRDLFLDIDDRRDIVARISAVFVDGGTHCFGWTLMSNHLHAVVKTGAQRLGTLMQRVLTGYAMRFNARAGRRGYLLQGRYGSRPLRDDADLLVVIRYVLRNPLANRNRPQRGRARALRVGRARRPDGAAAAASVRVRARDAGSLRRRRAERPGAAARVDRGAGCVRRDALRRSRPQRVRDLRSPRTTSAADLGPDSRAPREPSCADAPWASSAYRSPKSHGRSGSPTPR